MDSKVLTSKMLHDIRNSLNAILGYSQMFQDEENLNEDQLKMAQAIERSASKITTLLASKSEETTKHLLQETSMPKKKNNNSTSPKSDINKHGATLCENEVNSLKMKILLMEDEVYLRQSIKRFLTLRGHKVDDFENGEELLKNANLLDYDFIILDVNTPKINGFEIISYIRQNDILTPIIFISALTDIQKILKAFELGAADYLKKPFNLAELEARMLRSNPKRHNYLQLDNNFKYNLQNHILLKNEVPSKLSPTQKKLLYILIKNQNTLVTFDTLREYVWEDKEISHSTILSTMRDLKKTLPNSFIQNIRGEGYVGVVPIEYS
jgi:DNA-binding response OmpR family regulator